MTETPVDTFIGSLVHDRFTIEELIGRGGMAAVYRARDESLGRPVALKIFRSETADPVELRRQRGEIELLASLNHPSLVTLFDAGVDTDDNQLGHGYLVMELVEGENLSHHLARGPLLAGHVSTLGAELAEALHYIHGAGVIHRDVKPANILLVPSDIPGALGRVKLADFGIALLVDVPRMTEVGAVLGTASYLSPEQALGQSLTPATDVYSLGLVLLECLTGKRAFPGSAIESATARVLRSPTIPSSLPNGWPSLLAGMTARDPELRPSALDVAQKCRLINLQHVGDQHDPGEDLEATAMIEAMENTRGLEAVPSPAPTDGIPGSITGITPEPSAFDDTATQVMPRRRQTRESPQDTDPATNHESTGQTAATQALKSSPELTSNRRSTRIAERDSEQNPDGDTQRKRPLVAIVLAIVVAAVVVTGAIAFSLAGAPDTAPPPSYPPVPGELGTHLQQLQESIEP